jgi:hypothetical protein
MHIVGFLIEQRLFCSSYCHDIRDVLAMFAHALFSFTTSLFRTVTTISLFRFLEWCDYCSFRLFSALTSYPQFGKRLWRKQTAEIHHWKPSLIFGHDFNLVFVSMEAR